MANSRTPASRRNLTRVSTPAAPLRRVPVLAPDPVPLATRARPVLEKYFSFDLLTRSAIGPAWKDFTAEQQKKITSLFTKGEVAGKNSDYVVLTSDNPRSEDALAIINDALVGLRRTDVEHRIEHLMAGRRACAREERVHLASAGIRVAGAEQRVEELLDGNAACEEQGFVAVMEV